MSNIRRFPNGEQEIFQFLEREDIETGLSLLRSHQRARIRKVRSPNTPSDKTNADIADMAIKYYENHGLFFQITIPDDESIVISPLPTLLEITTEADLINLLSRLEDGEGTGIEITNASEDMMSYLSIIYSRWIDQHKSQNLTVKITIEETTLGFYPSRLDPKLSLVPPMLN